MQISTTNLLLTASIVLASFLGGLVAVLIGQFLSYYRDQRNEIERLYYLVEYSNNLDNDIVPYSVEPEDLDKLLSELQELYISNRWWMEEHLRVRVGEQIIFINSLHRSTTNYYELKNHSSDEVDNLDEIINIREDTVEIDRDTVEIGAEKIMEEFERVPVRKFISRYAGFVTVDSPIDYVDIE